VFLAYKFFFNEFLYKRNNNLIQHQTRASSLSMMLKCENNDRIINFFTNNSIDHFSYFKLKNTYMEE